VTSALPLSLLWARITPVKKPWKPPPPHLQGPQGPHLSPWMGNAVTMDGRPLFDVGRYLAVWTATCALDALPQAIDWHRVFDSRIDDYDPAASGGQVCALTPTGRRWPPSWSWRTTPTRPPSAELTASSSSAQAGSPARKPLVPS
jgi:hypothetical protein